MDSFDVWLQLSPNTLIERFEELGAPGIVVGAERNCWPNAQESLACQGVPYSTLPKGAFPMNEEPRWANSGTVIGSVTAMRTVYEDLIVALHEPEQRNQGDQYVFNKFLASRRISVDYRSRLFWPTYLANGYAHFINTPYHIDDVIPHELYPPLLHHSQTGEVPVAIHFNGPDKPLIEEWWGKLWWQNLQDGDDRFRDIVASRVKGAEVRLSEGGHKKWRDLCPMDVIGI